MSSLETRTNASGDTSYRVRFYSHGRHCTETFTSEVGAHKWRLLLDAVGADSARAALNRQKPQDGRNVSEQVQHHIDHLTGVTDGTRDRYTDYLRRRINTHAIGAVPLAFMNRDVVASWVNWMAKDGLSAKTIKNHHSLLSASLTSAVRDQLIPTNYAKGIRIATPDTERDEMVTLTMPELRRFIDSSPDHWRPMVMFLFCTGVRFGEASALRVGDIDADMCQARVTRAWKDTNGNGHQLGDTKSYKSRRTIMFDRGVAETLRPLLTRSAGSWLFTNTYGGPVRLSNFHEEAWAKTVHVFAGDVKRTIRVPIGRPRIEWVKGLGKRPTPHDARHTFASLQIQAGAQMAYIQRQLGHESITTTIDTYTHLCTEDLRSLAATFDRPLELTGPALAVPSVNNGSL